MEPRNRTHLVNELMQEAHLMMGVLEKAMEGERSEESGFVKLLRLRCSSGTRGPLPGPIRSLGGSLRACHFGPTREALPHLLTIVGR